MKFKCLQDFVSFLESKGELKRISVEVDPELEITEITDRVTKSYGPALLFENVKGSSIPLLINTYGSYKRMSWALGVEDLEEVAQEIGSMLIQSPPDGLWEKAKLAGKFARISTFNPKKVKTGLCKEVINHTPDLNQFPILKCWPEDGGKYITFPLVITKDPEDRSRNVGLYRMQVFDKNTTAMHWQIHKTGAKHYRRHEELGKRMEVAVVIGADPALPYAASAPLPDKIDEFILAGFLRKKSVDLVPCETIDLEVPANAEIVIEGYVDPKERRLEGPFGDHTGYYSLADDYPVFHVTCITHRKNPVYLTTIVGPPPQEDKFLGLATVRLFLPMLKMTFPEIVDMNLPCEGIFHNLVIVSIKKQFPFHAKRLMNSLWGMGQMMFSKMIIVVDDDVNVQNPAEVVWRASNNMDPKRDILFTEGPVDVLDHASPMPAFGSKMGIDATRKWPEEGFTREWPDVLKMSTEVKKRVDQIWEKLGLNGKQVKNEEWLKETLKL